MQERWMRAAALGAALGVVGASAAVAAPVSRQAHFSLSRQAVAQRARQVPAGARFRLVGVPLEARTVALALERFEVFTPDARVLVQGPGGRRVVAPPRRVYFRGEVADDPGSFAFLAVGEDNEARGLVMSRERVFVLGAEESATPEEALVARAFDESDAARQEPSWHCQADRLTDDPISGVGGLRGLFDASLEEVSAAASAQYSIEVAIETDYELFDRFDSVDRTAAYVGDLMGAISAIFYRDVGTTLRVNFLSLWTSASDPWTGTTSCETLVQFGNYWVNPANGRTAIPRGTAHFLSGKMTSGRNGIAWLNALCATPQANQVTCGTTPYSTYFGGFGVTHGIDGSFNPSSPTVVWDLKGTSHEIGHNFGSPHTHCYNNYPSAGYAEVDQCYGGESGCYSGVEGLPAGGKGSIMSYCQRQPGGLSNIAMSFGTSGLYGILSERVPQRMRNHVASRPASCRAVIDAPPADFNGDGRSEVFIYRNGAWLEFPAWPGN